MGVKKSREDSEAVSSIAVMMDGVEVGGGDEQGAKIIDESDMYDLDDDSDLEYVAGNIDYADFADHFASSSVGAYTMDQFDGAMTDNDTDMDDPEEKGEPEKNPGRAPSDTSSVSSDEIIDMEVEAEDVFPEIN